LISSSSNTKGTHPQRYTAKNAIDLMQVVDFNALMQFANKLYQACVNTRTDATWYLQTCCKLMKQLALSLHEVRNLQQVC
jgi:hypothetical protein